VEKRKDYTLGIVLVLIGLAILLRNTKLLSKDIFLVAIGGGFLAGYYNKKQTGYLIAGLILLVLGGTSLAGNYRILNIDMSGFLFLTGLGTVFLALYFAKNITGFIYPGCILIAIGSYTLIDNIFNIQMGWLFFTFLGLSFYAMYLIEHRRIGQRWPLIPGTVLLVLSSLFFLTSLEVITDNFWSLISYFWPVILIIVGLRIIYNNSKMNS